MLALLQHRVFSVKGYIISLLIITYRVEGRLVAQKPFAKWKYGGGGTSTVPVNRILHCTVHRSESPLVHHKQSINIKQV